MIRLRTIAVLLAAGSLASGCARGDSPELACQKRIAAAREAPDLAEGSFGAEAYAKVDRSGCSARQLAKLDRISQLASALPELLETNNRIGAGKDEAAHMAAFQAMNDALIELNDLEQSARSDLAMMMQEK